MKNEKCVCEILPIKSRNSSSKFIGIDKRYAEITIKTCLQCSQNWVEYFIEYEHQKKSGRWYLGKINKDEIAAINPENAVNKLEKMDWYFYGGSYFGTTGMIGKGRLSID